MSSQEVLTQLEAIFAALDDSTKIALATSHSPLAVAMAALAVAEQRCNVRRLSTKRVSHLLEFAGVAATTIQITKAFARASD
jgi:hypothetical protein